MSLLTKLATDIHSTEYPGPPRTSNQRNSILSTLKEAFPKCEYLGQGRGRIVIWLPKPPHRPLTNTELTRTHDGIAIKIAYDPNNLNDGIMQNAREKVIWNQGSPAIEHQHLTPVFETGPHDRWLMMPYRSPINNTGVFEDLISEIFEEYPNTDIGAKSSWGYTDNRSIECIDYGRSPAHDR